MKIKELPKSISSLVWRFGALVRTEKLYRSGNYIDLITLCDEILSKGKPDFLAFYYRGLANESLGFFDVAIADFEQAQGTLDKYKRKSWYTQDFIKVPIQISRVYLKLQNKSKAFEYADKAVIVAKNSTHGLEYRSWLKEEFDDYIGALEDMNEALKIKPKNRTALKMRDRLTYIVIQKQREAFDK